MTSKKNQMNFNPNEKKDKKNLSDVKCGVREIYHVTNTLLFLCRFSSYFILIGQPATSEHTRTNVTYMLCRRFISVNNFV